MLGLLIAGLIGAVLVAHSIHRKEKQELKRFKQNLYSL